MFKKNVVLFISCLIFLISPQFSENRINISGVRPPFFILKISEGYMQVKANRKIYSEAGIEVAKFIILNTRGEELLCKCLDDFVNLNSKCFIKVKSVSGKEEKTEKKISKSEPGKNMRDLAGLIRIRGIRFIELKKGVFITENPVPASMVPRLSFSGIDDFMRRIENGCGEGCNVNYLDTDEIKKYFTSGEEKIMLGLKSGEPVLVFFSESELRENPVSEKIISKLKYEIYIPLKLKRLQQRGIFETL